MLSVQLLIGEWVRPDLLDLCLDSIPGWCQVVVGDAGAPEGLVRKCLARGADIVAASTAHGMDRCRNELLAHSDHDWCLLLEPWEELSGGEDVLVHRVREGVATEFMVIGNDSLTRQVRLWDRTKGRFINPVYERVDVKGSPSNCVIVGGESGTLDRDLNLAENWVRQSPTIPDPYYYRGCLYLAKRRYDDFLKDAETYLFMESSDHANMSITMTRYYRACVHCYVKKDASKALQSIAPCLLSRPLMAEFWCLVGDVHYHLLRRYDKAASFYENALVLGPHRLAEDPWPMEISKYDEHPSRMLANCREIVAKSARLGGVHKV
jgi:hypothetical protein